MKQNLKMIEHLPKCHKTLEELGSIFRKFAHSVEYEDLYGITHWHKAAVEIFMKLLEVRRTSQLRLHLPVGHHWTQKPRLAWEPADTSSFRYVMLIILM